MLSAESQVDAMIDWWKDKGLTRNNPVRLTTCKEVVWPWILAGLFRMLEDWFGKR